MKYLGILASFLFIFQNNASAQQKTILPDSVIITEIMFYAPSGNNEFIEIYNISSSAYVDLMNYQVKYYTSLPDTITDAGYGTILAPGCYAVVFEGDYDFENGIYKNIVPASALVLRISNAAFGSNGMANTTSRPVWLVNPAKDTVDCRYYTADNSSSVSDEKSMLTTDTSGAAWGNSLLPNGTPGFPNSIQRNAYDICMKSLSILPAYPVAGDDLEIYAHVVNNGYQAADSYEVKIYHDRNSDTYSDATEEIFSQTYSMLNPGDSIIIVYPVYNITAGLYNFIAEVKYDRDENLDNNTVQSGAAAADKINFNDIVINEIMYAPQNGEPEWVELFNRSTGKINLKDWRIRDASTTVKILNTDFFIYPGEYAVITRDSLIKNYYPFAFRYIKTSLPALNNTGDGITLIDSIGLPVDSVTYMPDWGGLNNYTLERVNPEINSTLKENWQTSVNPFRGTPGFINSVTQKKKDASFVRFTAENEFAVCGEEINIITAVRNNGSETIPEFKLCIYYDKQRDSIPRNDYLLKEFRILNLFPGETSNLEFNYAEVSEGVNSFIAMIISADDDTCNNIAFCSVRGIKLNYVRNDILINEIMYAPEGEPEWIELYNASEKAINLKNFRICDRTDSVIFLKKDKILLPGQFLVLTNDSTLFKIRNIPSEYLVSSLPSLNNTGDRLMMIDSLDRIIDSLEYSPYWGGKAGYSLERNNYGVSSTDSLNWKESLNNYKATPGWINSVTPKLYDCALLDIIFSPEFPVKGETAEVSVKIINKGSSGADAHIKLFKDDIEIPLSSGNTFIEPGSSAIINTGCSSSNSEKYYAEVITSNDQDTSNNYVTEHILFGYEPGTIVINEILFNPQNGEPEWIELYNPSVDTVNIKGWKFKDILAVPSEITLKDDFTLLPKTFLVLTSDSSIFNSHNRIPSDVIFISIPNLNNDQDGVIMKDNRGLRIDSMFYQENGRIQKSLERVSAENSSLINENWGYSRDIEQSTPGRVNSLSPKEYDLAIEEILTEPVFPVSGDSVKVSVVISNYGYQNVTDCRIKFFRNGELISTITGISVTTGERLKIDSNVYIYLKNPVKIRALAEIEGDEDEFNNSIDKEVCPGEKSGCIVINEIMYDPLDTSEWVEVLNTSDSILNLKQWSISDAFPSKQKGILTENDYYLSPGEYAVISLDSTLVQQYPSIEKMLVTRFGSLSSTLDGVFLYDYRGAIIDSVIYKGNWGGGKGKSLERKSHLTSASDSSNWCTSLGNATPGEKNSVSGVPEGTAASVVINEIMYDPAPGNCEYIELYNRSGNGINIGGWRVESEGNEVFIIIDSNFIIESKSYILFAADSTVVNNYSTIDRLLTANRSSFSLNNQGQWFRIRDLNGLTIDSVLYLDKQHNRSFTSTKNRSLERINSEIGSTDYFNWTSSVSISGGTPGTINSVNTNNNNDSPEINISPNPFSPDNDGWEDFAIITYSLKIEAPHLRIRIYDSNGRMVRNLADTPAGSTGSLIFDGRDDEGRALRMGIYVLYIEAAGVNGREVHKSAFVIARKL